VYALYIAIDVSFQSVTGVLGTGVGHTVIMQPVRYTGILNVTQLVISGLPALACMCMFTCTSTPKSNCTCSLRLLVSPHVFWDIFCFSAESLGFQKR
jgi:hypothetical protein